VRVDGVAIEQRLEHDFEREPHGIGRDVDFVVLGLRVRRALGAPCDLVGVARDRFGMNGGDKSLRRLRCARA
jgi:hypothetical protein